MKKKIIETQKKAMMRSPLHTSVHKKLYEITDTTELWCRSLCIIIDRYLFDKIWYSAADQSSHSFCFLLRCQTHTVPQTFWPPTFPRFPNCLGENFQLWFFFFTVLFAPTKHDERVHVYITYISNIRYYIFFSSFIFTTELHLHTRTHKIIRVQQA